MSLKFFNNILECGIDTVPDTMYRNIQQEYINLQWDNTSALYTVKEEEDIGSLVYNDLDVWLVPTVADTSTGMKDTRDFNKLIFKDINHKVKRGLMYKFDDCYWIVHSYSEYDGIVQDCGIRRCNNILKIVDPENGSIFSIPCVVDYDMAASTVKVTKYILTPSNHAVILVQGNSDTLRLFKTNSRFMLSGRPFKLYGYQNAVEYSLDNQKSTLLYLDLYLDEFRDGDDVENGIAANGKYDYSLSINSENLILENNSIGVLSASVILNGKEVERNIIWKSQNDKIIEIDEDGNYKIHGEIGQIVNITATLSGNADIFDVISITIGEIGEDIKIVLNPDFNKIRQYSTLNFVVDVYYNGILLTDNVNILCSTNSEIFTILENEDYYSLNSVGISSESQYINIIASCENPLFNKEVNIPIQAVSMYG